MGEVKAILLGVPKLMLGENVVNLPFKQAEALCYYLLVEKKADKYRIADLIWGDKHTEEKVKTNMRNALYVIRKTLGRDFLWEQGQNVISLNPNWNITVDTDILTMDMDVPSNQYFGEFLDNFYLKSNEFYNEWILSTRRYLKTLYINKLKKYIADSFALSNFDQCERYCNYLLTADEFDEVAYRGLIALYQRKKEYSKALDLYKKLEKLLSEELFEVPAKETQMLAQKVKEERNHEIVEIINQRNHINKLNQEKKRLFYGRKAEMGMISEELHSFITDNNAHSIFLSGEAGIGKTSLAEVALDNIRDKPDVYILHTRCYHAEKDYLLKPWQNIFEQLLECLDSSGDKKRKDSILNATSAVFPYLYDEAQIFSDINEMTALQYANYEKVLINTLLKLPAAHKYVFFFDDLQYADKSSVALIFNIIMTGKNKNILFILTCREEQYDFADLFAGELKRASLLKRKTLERFSSEETACFAKLLLPDYEFTDEHYSRLYQETEGNPFFIIEMLNSVKYNTSFTGLTPNIKEVMRGRLSFIHI